MAVEAARGAVPYERRGNLVDIAVASTTFPYADLSNAGIMAAAIGASESTSTADVNGSQPACTTRLRKWPDAAAGERLLFASERPLSRAPSLQEFDSDAGGVAVALGADEIIARCAGGASRSSVFVDHFRACDSSHDHYWEERWVRDAGYAKLVPGVVKKALANVSLAIEDVAHLVIPTLLRGIAGKLAKAVGFKGELLAPLVAACGYAGASKP